MMAAPVVVLSRLPLPIAEMAKVVVVAWVVVAFPTTTKLPLTVVVAEMRPPENVRVVVVALLGNGQVQLLNCEVVVAISLPLASAARKVPAAVASVGRYRVPKTPPAVEAPTTTSPPTESFAYGEVVPSPKLPAAVNTEASAPEVL